MFADIAFPINSYQVFTYQIPTEFEKTLSVGMRVKAPLGKRNVTGIVVAKKREAGYKGKIRSISGLVDDLAVLDSNLWDLIRWLSTYYCTPLGDVAKTVMPARLSVKYEPPERWMVVREDEQPQDTSIPDRAVSQIKIWNHLKTLETPVPVSELSNHAGNPLQACQGLAAKGLVKLFRTRIPPGLQDYVFQPIRKEISFSESQQKILNDLQKGLITNKFSPYLLHGVTGSGKTEIYIEMVKRVLEQGKSAIILLPEIALTPQIAGRFYAAFKDEVALWHSKLTPAARSWTWRKICENEYRVVIGARSAIFAPLRRLGLIIVDEEQEHAFKQESPAPRYHARDVAMVRGKQHEALVINASATPSLESFYNQSINKYRYLYLADRFGSATYPKVHIVDMIREQEESGKSGQVLSGLLLAKIEERLNSGEQVILLQNRRGYAPVLRCNDCGTVAMCPNCNISLIYHSTNKTLRCHICDYIHRNLSDQCESCSGYNLKLKGTGTQKVEKLVGESFPQARISRLDVDTAHSGLTINRTLEDFARGKIDILLGTQMIAKGLDFENATLVGLVNADTGLFLPDFRSGERIFQLLYQASGRAGRRSKQGEVVLQTYNAGDPVIKHAVGLDLKGYYSILLNERKELNYPPFSWMVKVEFSGSRLEQVEVVSKKARNSIRNAYKGLEILGPAFCYREKIRGKYRIQVVFKSNKELDPKRHKLRQFIQKSILDNPGFRNHQGVKINIDVDPGITTVSKRK